MQALTGLLVLTVAGSGMTMAASPAQQQVVKNPVGVEIVIPAGSPVKFKQFDEDGEAHFTGSFLLTGTFAYWCQIGDCGPDEQPLTQDDLILTVIVDPDVAARLPHWGKASEGAPIDWRHMQIEVGPGEDKVAEALVSPEKLKALLAGKIPRIEGRIAIVADNLVAGLSCDNSPYYVADFVRFATAAEIASAEVDGIDACP
jgi:hypothetical protein